MKRVEFDLIGAIREEIEEVLRLPKPPIPKAADERKIRPTPVAAEAASVTASEGDDTDRRPVEHDG